MLYILAAARCGHSSFCADHVRCGPRSCGAAPVPPRSPTSRHRRGRHRGAVLDSSTGRPFPAAKCASSGAAPSSP